MGWKITCESSADLGAEIYKKHKIGVIPFTITLGDKDYKDGEIKNEQLFDFFKETKTLPKTSALNEFDYEEFWKKENTEDGIIHLCLSSKISSTYNNAVNASKKFDNVYVIDSESLSSGIGIQVMYAVELRDKKVDIKEAVQLIEERKKKVQISFCIDSLTYLHKGGRCSALTLLGANLLGIKPSILVSNGKMTIGKKYRGKIHKILDEYVADVISANTPSENCVITYSSATPEMLEEIKKALDKHGKFKKISETTAGATVTTHCGPNTIGIIFYND
jgi:DegV family protein with EDD domain